MGFPRGVQLSHSSTFRRDVPRGALDSRFDGGFTDVCSEGGRHCFAVDVGTISSPEAEADPRVLVHGIPMPLVDRSRHRPVDFVVCDAASFRRQVPTRPGFVNRGVPGARQAAFEPSGVVVRQGGVVMARRA